MPAPIFNSRARLQSLQQALAAAGDDCCRSQSRPQLDPRPPCQ
jgi:hypothetical protein